MQFPGEQRVRIDKEDSWVWKDRETTLFMVKSAYKILKEYAQGAERDLFVGFCRLKAQPSSHLTAWRAMEDKIVSKANLVRRGICMTTNICCMCGEEEETMSRLFCTCRVF